ncbi:Os09g0106000 [Oryza sativa Japonica Group]|uniref:Os09g0106000 protein n=1 Tax=Oryza sativa subsp. japonica TaxID=39947 RepID=A0A0P0XJT3_ORYSJ|nr:Os09g0106000 [Oryza sativa Japonica Group]
MAPPEVVAGISPRGALARGKAIPLRSRVSFTRERQLNFAIALSDSDFAMLSHFPGANIGDTDGLFPQIVRYPISSTPISKLMNDLKLMATSSLRLCGERVVATSRVSVDPAARSGASDVSYPTERDDGWMEVKLAEFSNDERMLTEAAVMVDFREVNDHVKKIGLIVEGLEFRPTIH